MYGKYSTVELNILLFIQLSLCNGQWPLQMIGRDDFRPAPQISHQPGYPYDLPQWAETENPDLKLPESAKLIIKLLKTLEPPSSVNDNDYDQSFNPDEGWVMQRVKMLVEGRQDLRNETDELMDELQYFYHNMAMDEADNHVSADSSYKYGMSVILRFLLEFYRLFRKFSQSSHSHLPAIDVYGLSYDNALQVMKTKKKDSPLQIAVPVRRAIDIFKSILYESVEIVQTNCSMLAPGWQCVILYIANLITESKHCPTAWYHAFIHLIALETKIGLEESVAYKIPDTVKFKDLVYFENVFDFLIEKLVEYRERGRVQLTAEAVIFTMLADLQENGLLDCISVDRSY